jgi:hypothetical protein
VNESTRDLASQGPDLMLCEPVLSQSTAVLAQLRCLVGERHLRARRTEFAFWVGHSLSQHELEPARILPEQVDRVDPTLGGIGFARVSKGDPRNFRAIPLADRETRAERLFVSYRFRRIQWALRRLKLRP